MYILKYAHLIKMYIYIYLTKFSFIKSGWILHIANLAINDIFAYFQYQKKLFLNMGIYATCSLF